MSAKIALFGLPASGKGTLAANISKEWGYQQLSTGDMIRRLKEIPGPIGDELRALPVGAFASDDLIVKAVKDELQLEKYQQGVIFDGFPRTVSQWNAMKASGIKLDAAIYLQADEQTLIDRAIHRRVHLSSGRIYNLKTMDPNAPEIDSVTGEALTWRDDDKTEIIQKRFIDYWNKTYPVVQEIKSNTPEGCLYVEINGLQSQQVVWDHAKPQLIAHHCAPEQRKPKIT